MKETYVFNIQRYSLHDGAGIRTIVFLKGCPMRCRWCCNPESQKFTPEISYLENKCIGSPECDLCKNVCPQNAIMIKDKAVINKTLCTDCLLCTAVCPSKAIKPEGKAYSVKEIIDIVEKDSIFYSHGKGGLTVSGGEPLAHGNFLISLLKESKLRRISTAIETCGHGDYKILKSAASFLDEILFDIKSMNEQKHREYTGCSNKIILENFTRLCKDFPDLPKKVRTPIIPGFNDTKNDICDILKFLEDKPNTAYEPLKYHTFGKGKYKTLGRPYPMGTKTLKASAFDEILTIAKTTP